MYVRVSDVDGPIGYAAGSLRQAAIRGGFDPPPSGVDAAVAAQADALAATDEVVIITSDLDDFEILAALATNASRLSTLRA
jgi:predicted nucleic acid-binding protein